MQNQLLLLFLLPSVIYASNRIVGGDVINITDVPYQLSLRCDGKHICGASILNASIAITAAHCLEALCAYSIKAGISNLNESGEVIHVKRFRVHPNYDEGDLLVDYDIAILYLNSSLTFSASIQPVKLPEAGDSGDDHRVREGMIGTVSGFGTTSPRGKILPSDELRAVELPVVEYEKCNDAYDDQITTRMFCAGLPKEGKDSCVGDSGGPFVEEGVLYGIVSTGVDCADPDYPGVYANVKDLRGFIKKYAGL